MYSDLRPDFVLPDCREGREYFDKECRGVVTAQFCDRYRPMNSHVWQPGDERHPISLPFCGQRDRMGDRQHNWCFSCMAGYFLAPLYKEDALCGAGWEKDRHYDSAIVL